MHVLTAHDDEVLDVCFDYPGRRIATASNDCTAKVWDLSSDFRMISEMTGHLEEVSKVGSCPDPNLCSTTQLINFDFSSNRLALVQPEIYF